MTTIDPDKLIQPISGPKAVNGRSKPQEGDFKAVFQQAIDTPTIKPAKAESAVFVSDVRPAQFAAQPQPSTNMVVDRVQRLIDTMAEYQNKLIENGATLKDMHGLVQQMASHSESLAAAMEEMGESENLKAIVNQSLMLSSMEIAKYNGGSYID